jgi:hypothetical protein
VSLKVVQKNSERKKTDRLRQALANETAKIITLEGVRDYHRAKMKASERLGNSQHGSLPSNFEIEQAIISFQNTFIPDHQEKLTQQRHTALQVMRWLHYYTPYLVGNLVEGTVGINAAISIHVFSDSVEQVIEELQNKHLKLKSTQQRLKLNNGYIFLPTISFEYQDFEIEVLVFTLRQQHQHPKSKSQNRSMQRLNIKGLNELLFQ